MLNKLTDYPALAEKTEKNLGNYTLRLLHSCIGLQTEVGEIAETVQAYILITSNLDSENITEEVGDVLWYLAIIANALEIDFFIPARSENTILTSAGVLSGELTILSGKIADVVKRFAIYEKAIDVAQMEELIKDSLEVLASFMELTPQKTLLSAARQNIEKLAKRYPEKYTNEAALARADKA